MLLDSWPYSSTTQYCSCDDVIDNGTACQLLLDHSSIIAHEVESNDIHCSVVEPASCRSFQLF